jgi:hypothetical protein
MKEVHRVAANASDAIGQWYNAGGMVSFYDYPLETYLNASNPSTTWTNADCGSHRSGFWRTARWRQKLSSKRCVTSWE